MQIQSKHGGNRTVILMNTLEKLQDANAAVRARALRALRRTLGPAELAQHAEVVVALLEDTDACVRAEVVMTAQAGAGDVRATRRRCGRQARQ